MLVRLHILLLTFSLSLAPIAYAHSDGGVPGTPKTYCEGLAVDANVHEYGPGTGFVSLFSTDGNVGDCDQDGISGDFDGHNEYLAGGGTLIAGFNSLACFGLLSDHPEFPTVAVADAVLGLVAAPVSFIVAADTINNVPPVDPSEPNCGDFETDYWVECVDVCSMSFPSGLDGAYQVYVTGVQGHIITEAGGYDVSDNVNGKAASGEGAHPHNCPH